MKTIDWLRAFHQGRVVHDWNPITIARGGHTLVVYVSTDAAKVDGHRENIGARGQQLVADCLNALLPTAIIQAERHRQTTAEVVPITMDINTATAWQHSDKIDEAIMSGRSDAGARIVSDVGKTWTIDRLSADTVAIAEGFFVESATPITSWRGIPMGPAEATNVYAVRVSGVPQVRAGRHGLNQGDGDGNKPTDYSQMAMFVRLDCELDGNPDWLDRIYQDPELCVLVSAGGKPLPARHPGVVSLAESSEWKQVLAEGGGSQGVTPAGSNGSDDEAPEAKPWLDPFRSWGERAALYGLELHRRGVRGGKATPPSPEVAEMFRPCVRDGQGQIGLALARSGGNWCAAFAGFCAEETRTINEPHALDGGQAHNPHLYRASGLEMQTDAVKHGTWRDKKLAQSGQWQPSVGDVCILQRGRPGHPEDAWMRHVARLTKPLDGEAFETVGGNEGDVVRITKRKLSDGDLIGFIEYQTNLLVLVRETAELIVEPLREIAELIGLVDEARDGDNA